MHQSITKLPYSAHHIWRPSISTFVSPSPHLLLYLKAPIFLTKAFLSLPINNQSLVQDRIESLYKHHSPFKNFQFLLK